MTSITSSLTSGDQFRALEKSGDEFKENCTKDSSSDECQEYFNLIGKEELDGIEYELTKKNLLQRHAVKRLKEEDPEKLKEFAEKYIKTKGKDEAQILAALNMEFDAQKDAILAKLKKQTRGHANQTNEEAKKNYKIDTISNGIKDVQEENYNPNAIRDNIFYANVVNSYLERKDSKTNKSSQNTVFLDRELDSFDAASSNDQQYMTQVNSVKQFMKDNQQGNRKPANSNQNGGDIGDILGLFDLIQFGETKEETNN